MGETTFRKVGKKIYANDNVDISKDTAKITQGMDPYEEMAGSWLMRPKAQRPFAMPWSL